MSEVKIYTFVMGEKEILGFQHGDEKEIGEFVKYKDYAALEDKCSALVAENAKLADCANFYRLGFKPVKGAFGIEWKPTEQLLDDCGNTAIEAIKTPATGAFMAEIERKAIRKFINSIEHILRDKLSQYDTEEMLEAMRIFLEEQGGAEL